MYDVNAASTNGFLRLPDTRYLSVAEAARYLIGLPQRQRGLNFRQTNELRAMKQRLRDSEKRGQISLVKGAKGKVVRCSALKAWAIQHQNPTYRRELGLGARRLDVTVSLSGVSANASVGSVDVVAGGPGYPYDEILAYRTEIASLRQRVAQLEKENAALQVDAARGRIRQASGRINGPKGKGVPKSRSTTPK